jgi:uncharacterized repeat protein (TIGR01451 family)
MNRHPSFGSSQVFLTILVGCVIILASLVHTAWATPAQDPHRQSVPTSTPAPPTSTPVPPTSTPESEKKPDLVITKRGEPTQARPGEEVTFTLEVTNRGQAAAVDVVVTDDISPYLEILEVTTTQGTVTIEGQRITVHVGVVGPGFVVEIFIRTRVREDVPLPSTIENPPVIIDVPLLPPTGEGASPWQKEDAHAGVIPETSMLVLLGAGFATLLAVLRLRARRR